MSDGRVWQAVIAAAGLALLAAACTPSAPRSELGQVTYPRVVSLNPCTDAILAEVADAEQILAISHYSKDPRSSSLDPAVVARFPATRGSVEEVLALHPDLVLSSSFTDPATARAYARLGMRLERLDIAGTVDQSRMQIRKIAELVGHRNRGEALIARIDRALAAAAPATGSARLSAVVWQSGGIVPGKQALIVELLEHAGFANHAARRGLGQADMLLLETMLVDPPRVLFVVGDRDGAPASEGTDRQRFHPALAHLTGTRREMLDPRFLFCGGPTIIGAVEQLARVRRSLPTPDTGT